jgi:hypothetical protein
MGIRIWHGIPKGLAALEHIVLCVVYLIIVITLPIVFIYLPGIIYIPLKRVPT